MVWEEIGCMIVCYFNITRQGNIRKRVNIWGNNYRQRGINSEKLDAGLSPSSGSNIGTNYNNLSPSQVRLFESITILVL